MNYRHIYHAGNFTEVFKHIVLLMLVRCLQRKDTPFCYLDTHAGIGDYDLSSEAAQTTREYTSGIARLWSLPQQSLPPIVADYLRMIQQYNHARGFDALHFYPGSPQLVRALLRSQDRMILTELHPEDAAQLKQAFKSDRQVAVHHMDGYHALKAFLPPKQQRGVVLIDPPFEKTDEWDQIIKYIQLANKHWPGGIYAIWYPIKHDHAVKQFYQQLQATGIRKVLYCELRLSHLATTGLSACGMIVVNPPWQWQAQITPVLPWLCNILDQSAKGNSQLDWLTPE